MREILFGGVAIAVADRMGMRIYEELLTHPHRRFTAVELRAGMSGLAPGAFLGSSGPVVTANGIDALRRAYEDLNEDLAEAELQQDVRRQERIERELGALADELRRAVGRDGSPRQQTDASRARVAVAKALLRTRAELRHLHRPFHDYLVAAVTTGSVLRFSPLEGECWDC